jgi:16S rRNA (guanine1207-N2)-methyltransferase
MTRAADPRTYTNELFKQYVIPTSGQKVLALGIAAPVVLDWAQSAGDEGRIVAVEHWLPDSRALSVSIDRAGITTIDRHFIASLSELGEQHFDIAAIDCSSYPSNRAIYRLVQASAERLVPGGILFASGPKETGILSVGKRMEFILGNAVALAYRKGQRIIASHNLGPLMSLPPDDDMSTYTLEIGDGTWELERDPGVFAHGEVDDATAMLVTALDIEPDERVLDLGCGAGILGMVGATLASNSVAVLVDADAYALDLARRNCERNDIQNVRIQAADVIDTIADERFDVVICNPPFHQRHEQSSGLAERFMQGARSVLDSGGRLYFVANRFLPYESRLEALFSNVSEVAGDNRYKVLLAKVE